MGTAEGSSTSKPSNPPSSNQEVPTTPFTDWSSSMQAYYGAGATPFYPLTVASPNPHQYIWAGQHPLIPPYGTPVPYPAMYPPGGVYAHPGISMTPSTDVKDQASGKNQKERKVASGSGNDAASPSAESGSEGSSDGDDEPGNREELNQDKRGSFVQMMADANARKHVVAATNLNVGVSSCNPSDSAGGSTRTTANTSGATPAVPTDMLGRGSVMPEQWIDERELKRQKRKQSNRESARRSRLRKQAECEELQARVQKLAEENHCLKEQLQSLSEQCEKLTSESDSIREELTKVIGPEALANLERTTGGGTTN